MLLHWARYFSQWCVSKQLKLEKFTNTTVIVVAESRIRMLSVGLRTHRIGLLAAGPDHAGFCRTGTGGFRVKYKAAGSCRILPKNLNLYSYFYNFVIIMWNYTIK